MKDNKKSGSQVNSLNAGIVPAYFFVFCYAAYSIEKALGE